MKIARLAGFVYLIVILTGLFHLLYVPSQLIVRDDPSSTFNNILASETLFRLGIFVGLISYTAFLVLPIVLYKLLKPVGLIHARMMVLFAAVSVPITFVNMLNKFAVLSLISSDNYLETIDAIAVQGQVMFYLDLYNKGNSVAQIFWGLWLFPFGYLVYKSGFLPKVLGVFLMAGCFGYLINFTGYFFFPSYGESIFSTIVGLPSGIGEIGTCLWLLIMGAKENPRLANE